MSASQYSPAVTPGSDDVFMRIQDTFELLEHVLDFLPPPDLYNARDINRTFRQTIARSSILLVKLFRRPAPKPKNASQCILGKKSKINRADSGKKYLLATGAPACDLIAAYPRIRQVTPGTINPFLFHAGFAPQVCLRKGHSLTVCANAPNSNQIASYGPKSFRTLGASDEDLAKGIFEGSIWAGMYLAQPPVTAVEVDVIGLLGSLFHTSACKISVHNYDGVTCEDVFDAVRRLRGDYGYLNYRYVENLSFPGFVGLSLEEMQELEVSQQLEK